MTDLKEAAKRIREHNRYMNEFSKQTNYYSVKNEFSKQLSPWYIFGYQLLRGFYWFWINLAYPVVKFFKGIFGWFFYIYRYIWGKFVYKRDSYGKKRFYSLRAGVFVTASILSIYIWYTAFAFMFDAALYFTTVSRDETVFLTNQQEIAHEIGLHSVQGCHFLPCTDHNSIYFRVEASLFNELWSLTHGRGLFFSDFVAAAVPIGISECVITSYGVRWKLFLRGTEIYPFLLKVECMPVQLEKK